MLVENDFLSVGYNPELTVHETASSGNLLCRHDLRLFIAGGGSAQYLPARGQQSVKKRRNEAGFYPVSAGARQAAADQRGDHTFRKAQSIYQDLDNLRLLADNLARDPRAKITLGCLPSLGLSLVPELVTDFYQQNSNLVMTLTTEHTETLVKKLDLREIDLALTLQPVQQGEILTTLIAEVPLVYIDRHYRQGSVEIDQIDQQRWISPGPHSLSAAIATRRDFSTTRLNVQTYYMATEFVKRGMGCSITDIFSAQHNLAPEMIHPITPPMAISLCLLRRADVSLSPMAQKFVDFLCQRLRQQLKEINLRLYPDHKKSIAPLG